MVNNRLHELLNWHKDNPEDSFTLYALALEYDKQNQPAEALHFFEQLRIMDKHYLPLYLTYGKFLIKYNKKEEAQRVFQDGMTLARELGKPKVMAEIEQELDLLDDVDI